MAIKCHMANTELERNGEHCEACEVPFMPSPLPGILWPWGHEDGEHWYVDRCDMCQRYVTDDMAAGALWHYILENGLENHYLLGWAEWGPEITGGAFIDWIYEDVPGFEDDQHPLEKQVWDHPEWREEDQRMHYGSHIGSCAVAARMLRNRLEALSAEFPCFELDDLLEESRHIEEAMRDMDKIYNPEED